MAAVFDPASYQLSLLSLPFLGAALGLLVISFYVALMRGARLLRVTFLCASLAAMTCTMGFVLVGSLRSSAPQAAEVAELIYKLALALLPVAAVGVFAFEVSLVGQLARYRLLVVLACVMGLFQAAVVLTTGWYLDGVWLLDVGMYHYRAGPLYPLFAITTGLWDVLALFLGWYYLRRERSVRRRRQIRGSLLAFGTFTGTAIDMPLAYGIGFYPLGWVFLAAGTVLALRSLIQDALIDARVRDRRVPLALLYLASAGLGVWGVWQVAGDRSLLIKVPLLLLLYLALRVILVLGRVVRRPTLGNTLLERLADQHATRLQHDHTAAEIAAFTADTIELGLGCKRCELLLPARLDYSWHTVAGETLSESATPEPLILNWFSSNPQPVQREDLQARRLGEQREAIERLFDANHAEVLVPLVSRDEMVGMLILAEFERGPVLLPEEQRFLELVQEQAALALDYAHMQREANKRVEVHRQMELAATVQSAFVPRGEMIELGAVRISGLWVPASRCGGDWWWVHELADGRVLVLIGDVTGHGLPAAMVTAAAKGCYDVVQKLMGNELDLVELLMLLDGAVRTVGGESYHMTCFVSLLDPAAGRVTYANAGHQVPYLCRVQDGEVELGVLSARGTPLGTGSHARYRAHTRELLPGDTLVWYTDGLVESEDRMGRAFGDRRLQRTLRKIDHASTDARGVRDHIVRATLAFQGGVERREDDITLVVARVEAGMLRASSGGDDEPSGKDPRPRETSTSRAHPRSHL
jgi:serine phosphatase RsbU (regulator of sigma subunit)